MTEDKGNKQQNETPLMEKTCPYTFNELFALPIKEAHKKVKDWMDANGDPEKDDEVMQHVINKYQKYFYCMGVFESNVANFSIRIGRKEDGKLAKGMKIKFSAGRPITSPVRKRHENGHYMTTGYLNVELFCGISDDESHGIIKNIATEFAEKSERIIPSDFIPGNDKSQATLKNKQKDFIKLCKGKKFHNAYANASTADKKRIANIAKAVIVDTLLNNTSFSIDGVSAKAGGCYWLLPPMTDAYTRRDMLKKQLEEADQEIEQFEGSFA